MEMERKNTLKQQQRLTFEQKVIIGSTILLILMGLAFIIYYFKGGNIDKAYGTHKDKFTATHSLFFSQSGQEHFYTSNIKTNLNALSFWIYTPQKYTGDETTNNRVIGALAGGSKHSIISFGSTSANISGETFTIGDQNEASGITDTIPKGWNHIAINWSSSKSHYEIYLNGEKSSVLKGKKSLSQINNFQSYFGKQGSKNNKYYYGSVDEISIWSQSLADSFIKQLPYQVLDGSETGLEAYYRFNAGSGTNISDSSNNGNDGTLTQASAWVDTSGAAVSDSLSQIQSDTRAIYSNQTNATSDKLTISGNPGNNAFIAFGHDNKTGTTDSDQPTSTNYSNFMRFSQTWYIDTSGTKTLADLTFDLDGLLDVYQKSNYLLLKRDKPNQNFTIFESGADGQVGNYVDFNQKTLAEGYYTIGVKDTSTSNVSNTLENPKHAGKTLSLSGSGEANFPTINKDLRALQFWFYTPNKYKGDETYSNRYIGSLDGSSEMILGDAANSKNATFTIQDNNTATYIQDSITAGWHHITLNWESGGYVIYLDGVKRTTTNQGQGFGLVNSPELLLGKLSGKSKYFDGKLDQVAMFNKNLTTSKIRTYMCERLSGNESNLSGLWHFDNSVSGTALDYVNSNDANLVGTYSKVSSGADIGVNNKNVINSSNWSNESLSFNMANGDTFQVNNISGNPDMVQIYYIDTTPNYENKGGNLQSISSLHHFGVSVIGDGNATYDVTYTFNSSYNNESTMDLGKRDDNAVTTWSQANATLNTTKNKLTLTNQSGTQYILGNTTSTALPVELMNFTARYDKHESLTHLKWATASETQNKHFVVQRSLNGRSFDSIDVVKGHGTTTEGQRYAFKDQQLPTTNGTIYYRLKQVDFDGGYELTSVKAVNINEQSVVKDVKVYPNPFRNAFKVELTLKKAKEVRFSLISQKGERVLQRTERVRPGSGSIPFQVNQDIKEGVYIFNMRGEGIQERTKLIRRSN